jgi:hypothetical protein
MDIIVAFTSDSSSRLFPLLSCSLSLDCSPFFVLLHIFVFPFFVLGDLSKLEPTSLSRSDSEDIGGCSCLVSSSFSSAEGCSIVTIVDNLLNLHHRMISPLIGSVLPVESSGQREFRTV